jgi:toxin ParE1/3/4
MTTRWTPTALRDLESLHAWIASDREGAAGSLAEKILAALEALERYPEMGRKGRVAGTRELVVAPYVIAYRVKRESIDILAIIHGRRRWPDSF